MSLLTITEKITEIQKRYCNSSGNTCNNGIKTVTEILWR